MSEGADLKKRRFLTTSTAIIGAVGFVGVATPFVKSWNPSSRAKAAGAPVEADISKLEVGGILRVNWRGKPVWIVRRSESAVAGLASLDSKLADPDSKMPQQPDYAQNGYRSIKPEFFVAVGICTHLGCAPTYRPEIGPADMGADWIGGFFCPCHGSKFDLAGRVYSAMPAPTNLVIPPYQFLNDNLIRIGEDGGAA